MSTPLVVRKWKILASNGAPSTNLLLSYLEVKGMAWVTVN